MIKKVYYKIFSILVAMFSAMIIFFVGSIPHIEGLNRYSPWADTRVAQGFSEEKFSLIEIGFDTIGVKQLIGEPISIQRTDLYKQDSVRFIWYYTSDGKSEHADFAWIGRELYIDKFGRVKKVSKTIHYD
jgi:hypothetical protein